jgi:hypothetical protein
MEQSTLNEQIKLIENLFINSSISINYTSFVISLIVAALLGFVLKKTYVNFSKSLSNREYFSDIFIPLCVITCVVITVVKFSLALSLGLVGALSIVRFRAAIKEPEELVFLFFCIGIGISTGANQPLIAIIFTLFVVLTFFIQSIYNKSESKNDLQLNNVINVTIKNKKILIEDIIKKIEPNTKFLSLKSSFFEKDKTSHTLWVEFFNKKSYLNTLKISNKLRNENIEVSFYSASNIAE